MSTPKTVFLHGWGLHGGIWQPTVARLAGIDALTPDLPGYGVSAMVEPYTAEGLADALAAQVAGPAIVVGWSLGGMAALAWAARHPQQVQALVLVATNPAFVNRPDWQRGLTPELLAGFASALAADYRATVLRFLSLQARGGDAARAVIAHLRASVFERGDPRPEALAAGLELLRDTDLRNAAGTVRCPTLIIQGDHDGLCPAAAGEWLAAEIPGARLARHPHAAHAPFLSHPDWFHAQMKAFLHESGA